MNSFEKERLKSQIMSIRDMLQIQMTQQHQSLASISATVEQAYFVEKAYSQLSDVCCEDRRPRKPWPTNCPNCAAPVTGPKCEYCGTRFE